MLYAIWSEKEKGYYVGRHINGKRFGKEEGKHAVFSLANYNEYTKFETAKLVRECMIATFVNCDEESLSVIEVSQ